MTERPVQASCSIVCYNNTVEQIERLLTSLADSTPPLRLYLIDNSSTEKLPQLAHRYGARYRHQPDNPGFSRSHNWALREALKMGSKYHFVLNPDIYFSTDVIGRLLGYMERHHDVGLLAPRVHYADGRLQPLCKLLPSPLELLIRRFFPALHRGSGRLARYELHDSGYDTIMDVPALSGCFMLIRAEVLLRTGLFDERFFLYFEDVDLSRRIGGIARTVFFPHVAIVHEYARGSYNNKRMLWHHIVSAIRYFNKWGWLWDSERDRINDKALKALRRQHTAMSYRRR
jgi:GT2 family glycosyltransferase